VHGEGIFIAHEDDDEDLHCIPVVAHNLHSIQSSPKHDVVDLLWINCKEDFDILFNHFFSHDGEFCLLSFFPIHSLLLIFNNPIMLK
jgi:hypothetical protein